MIARQLSTARTMAREAMARRRVGTALRLLLLCTPFALAVVHLFLYAERGLRHSKIACLCISLPANAVLRESVSLSLMPALSHHSLTFVNAVNGSEQDETREVLHTKLEQLPPLCDPGPPAALTHEARARMQLTPEYFAVLGCSLSHLKAIRIAWLRRVEWALIVEDDVVPDLFPFWDSKDLPTFVRALPPDWSVAQLSLVGDGRMWRELVKEWEVRGYPPVVATASFWSTGAYLISKAAMAVIMGRYSMPPGGTFSLASLPCINADYHLLKAAIPNGTFFVATPPLFTCAEDSPSSISNDVERRKLHRLSRQVSLDWSASAPRVSRAHANFSDMLLST
jgi:GR25 family glycosyltransferase involved in LPS biosynthesis